MYRHEINNKVGVYQDEILIKAKELFSETCDNNWLPSKNWGMITMGQQKIWLDLANGENKMKNVKEALEKYKEFIKLRDELSDLDRTGEYLNKLD